MKIPQICKTREFLISFASIWILVLGWGCYRGFCSFYDRDVDKRDFFTFMEKYGGLVGVVFTVGIGLAVVKFIRSPLEKEIRSINERIGSQLKGFDAVFQRSLDLLKSLKDDPKSSFCMIAASPVFGIALDNDRRKKWESALQGRIAAGFLTKLVCLRPYVDKSGDSPLLSFSKALASYRAEPGRVEEIFEKAERYISMFYKFEHEQEQEQEHPTFTLRIGNEPPFQLVIAVSGSGQQTGIFYFASTERLKKNIQVSGIETQDDRMTMLMDNLFEYWSKKADKPHLDMRTLEQRKRDFAMIKFWHNNQHDIERPSDDILPGLRIVVHKGVFPPTISVAGDPLLKALGLAANKLWKDKKVDQFKRVGVDIGTGCGILALMLAKYCQKVWATDLGEAEIENARENFERFKKLSTEKTCDFDAKQDNLFGQFSGSFQEGMVPLIVFNHPFYPSMHTVFGTGGEKGGREIIHEFLVAALGVLKTTKGGAIVMPYSEIAGDLHDPRSVATIFGYEAEILAEPKEQYGKSTIYMFTYNPRK